MIEDIIWVVSIALLVYGLWRIMRWYIKDVIDKE